MTDPPPAADRFRVGDVWRSPRHKDWQVERIHHQRGALLVRAVANRRTTQWRHELAIGKNMMDAWMRLSWGGER
jgi:hypothetical protein